MTATNIGIIRGVAAGSYGNTIQVTLTNLSGVAQDVSGYTGNKYAIAQSPDGKKRVQASVTFTGDGTDGIVEWSWADGDIDRSGDWEVQIILLSGSARIKSWVADMPVIRQLIKDTDIV